MPPGTDIGTLLDRGELDAVLKLGGGTDMNPGPTERELLRRPTIRRLFPDPVAEARRMYAKTGLHPINHVVVVRSSLVAEHPWLPLNLMAGFESARRLSVRRLREAAASYLPTGVCTLDLNGALRYGMSANRAVLDRLTELLFRQGLTGRRVAPAEVFHDSTMT